MIKAIESQPGWGMTILKHSVCGPSDVNGAAFVGGPSSVVPGPGVRISKVVV